jgi:hypothetical protein
MATYKTDDPMESLTIKNRMNAPGPLWCQFTARQIDGGILLLAKNPRLGLYPSHSTCPPRQRAPSTSAIAVDYPMGANASASAQKTTAKAKSVR